MHGPLYLKQPQLLCIVVSSLPCLSWSVLTSTRSKLACTQMKLSWSGLFSCIFTQISFTTLLHSVALDWAQEHVDIQFEIFYISESSYKQTRYTHVPQWSLAKLLVWGELKFTPQINCIFLLQSMWTQNLTCLIQIELQQATYIKNDFDRNLHVSFSMGTSLQSMQDFHSG